MAVTLRQINAMLIALAVMLGALGFEALSPEQTIAAQRINPATSNSFKITKLSSGKYRVALDLADRQAGEKVSIKTNRWINGELVFVLIGEAKVGRKGKTTVTLSRPIPVGVGISVATDSKLLIRRRIMQITGVPSAPAQVAPAPLPTPSPTPTQTIWYDYSPAPAPDTTSPTTTEVSTAALTDTTATLTFTPSETGTYLFMAKLSTDAAPAPTDFDLANFDPAAVGAGTGTIATAATAKAVTVSGLTIDTSYIVYLVIKDVAGNTSTIEHGATFITDVTAPTLANISVSALTEFSATLNFTPNEGGIYRYLVQASGLAPSAQELFAGAGTAGTASAASTTRAITGLATATSYTVYVAHKDAANNLSAVYALAFTTLADTTLPTISGVAARATGGTAATLRFTPSEAGTYYFIVSTNLVKSVVENATAPNISEFNTAAPGISVGTAGTELVVNLDNALTVNAFHRFFVVMKDAAGNLSAVTYSAIFLNDSTPSVLTNVAVNLITSTGAQLTFQSDDNGQYMVAVRLTSLTAPTAEQLQGGSFGGSGGYAETGNVKVIDFGGLTSSTSYTAYFVHRDEGLNLSALYSVIFTTLAAG